VDVVGADAELDELLVARGEQLAHELLVEAAPDDADAQALPSRSGASSSYGLASTP
jgi:hypothetical protein